MLHIPGKHGLLDAYGCPSQLLNNVSFLEETIQNAAQQAGAKILLSHLHHFGEQQGLTGVLLLAESHLSIHTWPEWNFAAIDIFLCGQLQPDNALPILLSALQPTHFNWQIITRGQDHPFITQQKHTVD